LRQCLALRELAGRLWARVTWWLTLSAVFTRKFSVRSTRTTRNLLKPIALLSRFRFSERDATNSYNTSLLEQSGTTAWDTLLQIAFIEEIMCICERHFCMWKKLCVIFSTISVPMVNVKLIKMCLNILRSCDLFYVHVTYFTFMWLISRSCDLFHVHVTYFTFMWLISRSCDLFYVHVTYFTFVWLILRSCNLFHVHVTYFTFIWLISRSCDLFYVHVTYFTFMWLILRPCDLFHVHVTYFTFMWPCIVTNFFIIKATRCTNFPNLLRHEILHK